MKLRKLLPIAFILSPAFLVPAAAEDVRLIVGFHGNADPAVFARVGGKAAVQLDRIGAVAGTVPAGKINALRRVPGVAYVEEDLVRHALAEANDTYYDYTFSARYEKAGYNDQRDDFALINAQSAWDSTSGAGVRVAVLDTGIDIDHTDLPTPVASKDFTGSGTVDDHDGHGSHVAGTVAAKTNNSRGVAGMAGGAYLLVGKVLGPNGGYDSWVANGMLWAAQQGARCVNMSLGGEGASKALSDAAQSLWNDGVLSVAAAGNSGVDGANHYPSADPNVMAVAAVNEQGGWASFSNYGPTVEVAAPGVSVLSTLSGGSYGWASGTSMASPHVAGAAALVLEDHPTMTVSDLRRQLNTGGSLTVKAPDGASIWILDAAAALSVSVSSPTVTIDSPADGQTVSGSVAITASASSPNGSVSKVEFFVDAISLGVDTNGGDGYGVSWDSTAVVDGSYTISAVVTDSVSETSSDAIAVSVDNTDSPPTVSVTSPSEGSTVSGTVTLAASASDDSAVARVEFFIDGVSVGSDTSAPYELAWNSSSVADGAHSVSARAEDSAGQTADSASVSFSVKNSASTDVLTVDSMTPSTVAAGSAVDVTITGTGFASGAIVTAENGSGSQPQFANVVVVGINTISATVSVKAGGPPRTRVWDVYVSSGGSTAVLPGGLTVTR